eukprot:5948945-Prymnesium_polylepis.1
MAIAAYTGEAVHPRAGKGDGDGGRRAGAHAQKPRLAVGRRLGEHAGAAAVLLGEARAERQDRDERPPQLQPVVKPAAFPWVAGLGDAELEEARVVVGEQLVLVGAARLNGHVGREEEGHVAQALAEVHVAEIDERAAAREALVEEDVVQMDVAVAQRERVAVQPR